MLSDFAFVLGGLITSTLLAVAVVLIVFALRLPQKRNPFAFDTPTKLDLDLAFDATPLARAVPRPSSRVAAMRSPAAGFRYSCGLPSGIDLAAVRSSRLYMVYLAASESIEIVSRPRAIDEQRYDCRPLLAAAPGRAESLRAPTLIRIDLYEQSHSGWLGEPLARRERRPDIGFRSSVAPASIGALGHPSLGGFEIAGRDECVSEHRIGLHEPVEQVHYECQRGLPL